MYPLSFREFCRAFAKEEIYQKLDLYGKSEEKDYQELEQLYQVYRLIGGYPQAVTTYVKTGSISESMEILENLIYTFTAESSRFFSNSTAMSVFQEVYKAVLVQMAEEKKGTGKTFIEIVTNFVKDSVKEPVSRNEVRQAASWLLYSGIIGYCDLYNNGEITKVIPNRRAYFADCGIANYISQLVTIPKDAIEGMLTETFVYTQLNHLYQKPISQKKVRGNKPCFSVCGDYELDFVLVDMDYVRTGIEVKSSENRARSLECFLEKGLIDRGVRAYPTKGARGKKYDDVPIYMIGRE